MDTGEVVRSGLFFPRKRENVVREMKERMDESEGEKKGNMGLNFIDHVLAKTRLYSYTTYLMTMLVV